MNMKHRGVAGLISLIGIVVAFSIASAAFLELNSSQNNLSSTSNKISSLLSDKANERLLFQNITFSTDHYKIQLENIGSKKSSLNSYLLVNDTSIRAQGYLNETFALPAKSFDDVNVNVTSSDPLDVFIFMTDRGKKCIIPIGASDRIC